MNLITKYFKQKKDTNYADAEGCYNPTPILKKPQAFFKHTAVKYTIKQLNKGKSLITFPSNITTPYPENNTVYATYRQPQERDQHKNKGIIIMLHGWKIASQKFYTLFMRRFLKEGYGVIFLELPYHLHRTPQKSYSGEYFITANLQRTVEAYHQAVLDVRCLIDFCIKETKNVALWGTSLGAITAALTVPFDPRIKGIISIVGGGNIAGICWTGISTTQVKRDCVQHNITFETVQNYWRLIDPVTYTTHSVRKKMLMINAEKDEYIAREFTLQLWEKCGKPRIVWLPTGHVSFVLYYNKVMRECLGFLEKRFTPP